jgi:hypothetical protein
VGHWAIGPASAGRVCGTVGRCVVCVCGVGASGRWEGPPPSGVGVGRGSFRQRVNGGRKRSAVWSRPTGVGGRSAEG